MNKNKNPYKLEKSKIVLNSKEITLENNKI